MTVANIDYQEVSDNWLVLNLPGCLWQATRDSDTLAKESTYSWNSTSRLNHVLSVTHSIKKNINQKFISILHLTLHSLSTLKLGNIGTKSLYLTLIEYLRHYMKHCHDVFFSPRFAVVLIDELLNSSWHKAEITKKEQSHKLSHELKEQLVQDTSNR